MYPHPDPPPLAGEGVRCVARVRRTRRAFGNVETRAPLTPSPAGGGGLGWGHSAHKVADV
jgi:hypothetical protein